MLQFDKRVKHPTYFLETVLTPDPQTASVAKIALPRAMTGLEALSTVAQRISAILYGADFVTQRDGNLLWLLRTAGKTDCTDYWPVQQYNLAVGVQSMRQVLGQPITPKAIRLSNPVPRAMLPEVWQHLPITLSRSTFGVAFDLDDLVFVTGDAIVHGSCCKAEIGPDAVGVDVLRECLANYLGKTPSDGMANKMAKAFCMSVRSYQRHLGRLGVSHRQLLSDARLCRAQALLADHKISITEIAFELGYTHSSAFTRFFKQRTGRTPQDHRRFGIGTTTATKMQEPSVVIHVRYP